MERQRPNLGFGAQAFTLVAHSNHRLEPVS